MPRPYQARLDRIPTTIRAAVNKYKYGSDLVTVPAIVALLRSHADELERMYRTDQNLAKQTRVDL